MTTIAALKQSYLRIIDATFNKLEGIGNLAPINNERDLIELRFGSGINDSVPEEKILKAILLFNESLVITDKSQAYLLSWGLVGSRDDSKQFIEHENFEACLNELNRYFKEKKLSALAWRGILHSYFNYAGIYSTDALGRHNWIQLRAFLKSSFNQLCNSKVNKPLWMTELEGNTNLLDEDPCDKYLDAALSGDTEIIDQLTETLAIPETSWFVGEVVLSQIYKICDYDDDNYKSYISNMLGLLNNHELYIDKGLASLLDRYALCEDNSENQELSKFALNHWKNPKLRQKNVKWGLVQDATKTMFLKWLTEKDIRGFFNAFKDDETADIRRMNFWLRYVDQIKDAYFSLGSQLRYSSDKELLDLIGRNDGRISRLDGSGMSLNCAFIMIFDNHVLIEYGLPNNACYCFSREHLPFNLTNRVLVGTGQELKDEGNAVKPFPINHVDTIKWGDWENRFSYELARLDIKPDKAEIQTVGSRTTTSSGITQSSNKSSTRPIKGSFDEKNFIAIVQQHNLRMEDNRNKGGALWVLTGVKNDDLSSLLMNIGFQYKSDRGWWYK